MLPYTSATGASGVAHLACEFGVPILSSGIDDFRDMARDEGIAIEFYETGSAEKSGTATESSSRPARPLAGNGGAEFLRRIAHDHATDYSPIFALVRSSSARASLRAHIALSQNSFLGSFPLGDFSCGCPEVANMDIKAILLVGGSTSGHEESFGGVPIAYLDVLGLPVVQRVFQRLRLWCLRGYDHQPGFRRGRTVRAACAPACWPDVEAGSGRPILANGGEHLQRVCRGWRGTGDCESGSARMSNWIMRR